MKNMFKKVMGALMAAALLVGVLAVPTQRAQAASKLTKADFKFTGIGGGYLLPGEYYPYYYSATMTEAAINKSKPKKFIKTKRGITLTSTKAQVFKKYGKVTLKKYRKKSGKTGNLYDWFKKDIYNLNDETKDKMKKELDLLKNEKCAAYSYKSGSDTFWLYFFFDKKEKINMIFVTRNL